MRKLLLTLMLLSAALLAPPSSHAQFIVVGQGCGAPGLSGIANDGTPVVCKGSPLVWTAVGGGGGGGTANSVSPVINVTNSAYSGCPSSTGDWTTCFTSVNTASNAAAKVSVGTPTIRAVVSTPQATSAISSATATVSFTAGDTVLVGVIADGAGPPTFSVSDTINTYTLVNLAVSGGSSEILYVFGTPVGAAKAVSGGTLTVTCLTNCPTFYGFIVLDAFNVGSVGQRNLFYTGTSTTPVNTSSITAATQDNNNLITSWLTYCGGGATTLSANTGTLQASWNGTAVICGGGLVTSQPATPGTATTSATISASEPWTMTSLELRSVQTTIPTIYIPYSASVYNYSSGLNPTNPTTIQCEPGATLNYTGTAHAIDLGPSGLTVSNFQGAGGYYKVKGCTFTGGTQMTEGIFIQNWILFVEISDNQFINFGNLASADVFANGNQNDIVITNNKYLVNDGAQTTSPGTTGQPRQLLNVTTASTPATVRFENNGAACISGVFGNVGCAATFGSTLPLISVGPGLTHIFTGNNFMGGFCPIIYFQNGDVNSKVEANHIETNNTSCTPLLFQTGVYGLHVINNYVRLPGGVSLLGPNIGTDVLANAIVSDNVMAAFSTGTPIVTLNNVAGNTGNQAWHNMCSPLSPPSTLAPCALIHTTGANISQWNADYAPKLTFAAGTTASYTFLQTYAVAPACTVAPNIPGTATTLTISTLNTTTLTITASAANSATVFANCNPEAAQ